LQQHVESAARSVKGGNGMYAHDVLLYHDLDTPSMYWRGDKLELAGHTWEVVSVEPPVHEGKAALLVCKLHPNSAPWPSDWRNKAWTMKQMEP